MRTSTPRRSQRRRLPILLAGLAVVALATPATNVGAYPAETTVQGTLQLAVKDAFDDEAGADAGATGEGFAYDAQLETARGPVGLRLAADLPVGFDNGAVVRVTGRRLAAGAIAFDGGAGDAQVIATSPGFNGPRRVAVALINFSNDASKPFTRAFANGVVFTAANSVRAYYLEESHGTMSITGTTFDWLRIPKSNATCDWQGWEDAARTGLAARGVDLSQYTNLVLMFPRTAACNWRGLGWMPGSTAWINGTPYMRVVAHELGHNMGIHHAQTLRCSSNGVRVALGSHCRATEYGDPFTTMGASMTRHMHNLELAQLGFLPVGATQTVAITGRYTLTHASATTGIRVIGIPRGDGTSLYLEYRRPYGSYFDNFSSTDPAVRGVTIRIGGGWSQITQSQLIDTRPSTTTFADAPLRVGYSFRDYRSGVKITVVAASRGSAVVTITLPAGTVAPSPAPQAP
jgi:Gametolysin peptidase M11